MGFSRHEYWSGLPFPSPVDHILSDLSIMTHPSWVAPQAWLGFIELDKAVVLVWLDRLVFCKYGFSVLPSDALLQHLPSYLGFSILGMEYSFTAAPAKHSLCSLLGRGVSPYRHRSWPSAWDSSSRPSWAVSNPERWCCETAALNMPANLENSAVATGLEKVSFHSNLKERQCQRMLKLLHNCTHLTC